MLEVHRILWESKKTDAMTYGQDVRRIESSERRALEKFSAEMARCLYRSIYRNQYGRTQLEFEPAPHEDRTEDARAMEYA